jgi:hypothetical protein
MEERRFSDASPQVSLGDDDDEKDPWIELLRTLTGVRGLGVEGFDPKEGCRYRYECQYLVGFPMPLSMLLSAWNLTFLKIYPPEA